MPKDRKYHGWIVREAGGRGFKDIYWAEFLDTDGKRVRVGNSDSGDWRNPAFVIEWWDKRVGEPVTLLATPLGAYRVYTEMPLPAKPTEIRLILERPGYDALGITLNQDDAYVYSAEHEKVRYFATVRDK